MRRIRSPLVHLVSRLPGGVHTKLLVPFVGTMILLVIVGLLDLQVLGDSNQRVEALGMLQQRASAYRQLQTDAGQLRSVLALRPGGGNTNNVLLALSTVDFDSTPGLPPADERAILLQISLDSQQLFHVMLDIIAFDQAGNTDAGLQLQYAQAEPLAKAIESRATLLVSLVQTKTNSLIAQNRGSFEGSQRLFIAVAGGGIALALLVGYILAWSLIGPIREMGARLEAIAAGDFSGHVRVINRDELGALATNINRTNDELGRLYTELETISRHKSEFLANMSHELRTPLNAIIGFSQVLQQQMFGDLNAKQQEYLDDILTSGQHLLNLINDILDLAKVEAGRMDLQPSLFALPATLENAVAMVRERATRQGIAIATEVDPSLQLIEADERKVKQILFNLLTNAVKFTPRAGRVKLSASNIGEFVKMSVTDNGVGISVEDQGRIFEEFYQASSDKTQEGTGLGLALTKRLVELHGGELTVASTPGQGSTFTFTLPIRQLARTELETPLHAEAVAP